MSPEKAYRATWVRLEVDSVRFGGEEGSGGKAGKSAARSDVRSIVKRNFSWGKTLALIPIVYVGYVSFVFTTVALGLAKME